MATNIKTTVSDEILFQGLPENFEVGRYHSWIVDTDLPSVLEATSTDEEGEIMSLRHRTLDVKGVQFHPEKSHKFGMNLFKNFIEL